jgi:hypothetical protein
MNKREERILREWVRSSLDEGKFTDWVADRVGIPREPSVSDMTPSGRYKDLIKMMNFPTLQGDYKALYGAFLNARGWGRKDHDVQDAMRNVQSYIVDQLTRAGVQRSIAMFFASEFIKSAEDRANEHMHREDRSEDRRRAWRDMLHREGRIMGKTHDAPRKR